MSSAYQVESGRECRCEKCNWKQGSCEKRRARVCIVLFSSISSVRGKEKISWNRNRRIFFFLQSIFSPPLFPGERKMVATRWQHGGIEMETGRNVWPEIPSSLGRISRPIVEAILYLSISNRPPPLRPTTSPCQNIASHRLLAINRLRGQSYTCRPPWTTVKEAVLFCPGDRP